MRVNLSIISGEMGGLGCLLLVLLLGSLEAVGAQGSNCSKSTLENGYFVPEDKVYKSGEQITYACEKGYKLRAEGWWAKSKCVNGKWSPEPLCIGEKDCFAKDFPNIDNSSPFTKNGLKKIIICEDGYELNSTTESSAIECKNGQWISTISCIKSLTACGEPPRVPHAVIIQRYRDIFKDNSVIQYICEDSYTMEGESKILCAGGVWGSKPTCKYSPPPIPSPRPTSPSDDDEFQSRPVRECGPKPKIQDGQLETEGIYTLTYKCNDMFTLQGPQDVVCRGNGWSERPLCSKYQNPTDEREKPDDKAVTECGKFPVLNNGVLVEEKRRSGRYQCSEYYKLEGSNVVYCRHNGMWSKPPTCLDPCTIEKVPDFLKPLKNTVYVMQGTGRYFLCKKKSYWIWTTHSYGICSQGIMTFNACKG